LLGLDGNVTFSILDTLGKECPCFILGAPFGMQMHDQGLLLAEGIAEQGAANFWLVPGPVVVQRRY
jgi:hypothetical protein